MRKSSRRAAVDTEVVGIQIVGYVTVSEYRALELIQEKRKDRSSKTRLVREGVQLLMEKEGVDGSAVVK